ncbi:MAG: hypothetical protein J6X18_17610 [Bacteroidales bacterium]|nr:hypothetical protein [Bacteroidales bacterium]
MKRHTFNETQLDRIINETIQEVLHDKKHKGKNILGYENDSQDEVIPNGINLGIVSIA